MLFSPRKQSVTIASRNNHPVVPVWLIPTIPLPTPDNKEVSCIFDCSVKRSSKRAKCQQIKCPFCIGVDPWGTWLDQAFANDIVIPIFNLGVKYSGARSYIVLRVRRIVFSKRIS